VLVTNLVLLLLINLIWFDLNRQSWAECGAESVTLCILVLAKRCDVLEQQLLLIAYMKSYMRNRLAPKWMTLTLFRGRLRSCQCQPLRHVRFRHRIFRKPLEIWFGSKWPPTGVGIKWSRDRWRYVSPKGQTRDPNTLRAQYLENSWRCYAI